MNERLPITFEKEVLEPASIYWDDTDEEYVDRDKEASDVSCYQASGYEIGARGLGKLLEKGIKIKKTLGGYGVSQKVVNLTKTHLPSGEVGHIRNDYYNTFYDKDFCQCIFKAIREFWK